MCLFGKEIRNRKYVKNKKNGGNVPPVPDERLRWITADCGNCIECRKKKAREWRVRLSEDIKKHKNGKMVTLTFSNESIKELIEYDKWYTNEKTGERFKARIGELEGYPLDNEIATVAMRLFNERWRKKYKKALRHWLVTELGHKGTQNIHMHGIIWTDEPMEEVEKIWKYGFIWKGDYINGRVVNYVNEKTVNYTTKYVNKIDPLHKTYKSIILSSPGIGKNYIESHNSKVNTYRGKNTNQKYTTRTGHELGLPAYYKNKLYTEEEKERMWIDKLDKEEKWIRGEKYNMATDKENYYKTLKYERQRNKELGYGSDKTDMKRKKYEDEMRKNYQSIRIQNAREKVNLVFDLVKNTKKDASGGVL